MGCGVGVCKNYDDDLRACMEYGQMIAFTVSKWEIEQTSTSGRLYVL